MAMVLPNDTQTWFWAFDRACMWRAPHSVETFCLTSSKYNMVVCTQIYMSQVWLTNLSDACRHTALSWSPAKRNGPSLNLNLFFFFLFSSFRFVFFFRALKEEEWRRNQPPLPGTFRFRPPLSDCGQGRRVSSVVCRESSSSSIFDVGGGGVGASESTSMLGLASANRKAGGRAHASGAGAAGAVSDVGAEYAVPARGQQGGDDNDTDSDRSSPSMAKRGKPTPRSSGGSTLFWRESEAVAGGRQSTVKAGGGRAETPAAWPPGGLGEGEGLRINDLPDVSARATIVLFSASSLFLRSST